MFLKEEREELKDRLQREFQFLTGAEVERIDELVATQKRKRGKFEGECRVCQQHGTLRNLDLYVFGSEGLNACHDCEMLIVKQVAAIARMCSAAKMQGYKFAKKTN